MTINRAEALEAAARERILVLDGAMGTMIQAYKLGEDDYRGERFADWPRDLKGNNDLLNLTQPDVIREIHKAYLDAGADIIETNTFNGTTISMADYGMEALAYEINREGARIACEARDAVEAADPSRRRFVAGSIGPTNRTTSISPDVNDPGYRATTFDEVRIAYAEAIRGLLDGGVDILLIETIFDPLNAKAAVFASDEVFEERGEWAPVMISGTITDLSGRTLTGQTVEAFWNSMRHAQPFAIGLNCSLGAEDLRQYVAEMARVADARILTFPNAGLPNEFGEYDETPDRTGAHLGSWAEDGLVNVVGGCCGTTPDHIRAIAQAVSGKTPRVIPDVPRRLRLSGIEPFELRA